MAYWDYLKIRDAGSRALFILLQSLLMRAQLTQIQFLHLFALHGQEISLTVFPESAEDGKNGPQLIWLHLALNMT